MAGKTTYLATLRATAAALALAASLPATSRAQAGAEWTTPAGTVQGTRYSTLTDITPANAAALTEEFSFATGARGSHEGNPLVVGSVMYVVSPFPSKLVALDLTKGGKTLWVFDPQADQRAVGVACCDVVNRGPAYADGMIIYNVLDGNTVAVDAVKGKLVWKTKLADPTAGEVLTGAPLITNNKVFVGNSGGELGVRGWIQALDLATGKPLWKAYNTGPDSDMLIDPGFHPFYAKDQGTDLGVSTWPGSMWQQGGSTSWGWLTYDPETNLLFYGTAQPGVWNPDMRPGDNKWSSTIFARNPDTGKAVWAYQLTPHDGWDFDAVNESIVADMKIAGADRKVIVHFNKNGFAYTIDRTNGQLVVAKPYQNVTWAKKVNLDTGLPDFVPSLRPHQGKVTSGVCPTPQGAKDFEPSAYSPATNLFYVPSINLCYTVEPMLAMYIAATPFMGAHLDFAPGPGGFAGELVAWDAANGKRAWSIQEPLPVYSGVLATAGNLVFYGTLDKQFKAVDATTGKVVFQKQLECGITSNPMTFTGPDGKQRVAVMTGIGWLAGALAGGACPSGGFFGASSSGGSRAAALDQFSQSQGRSPADGGGDSGPQSGVLHVFKLP